MSHKIPGSSAARPSLCFHAAQGKRCTRYLEGAEAERDSIVKRLRALGEALEDDDEDGGDDMAIGVERAIQEALKHRPFEPAAPCAGEAEPFRLDHMDLSTATRTSEAQPAEPQEKEAMRLGELIAELKKYDAKKWLRIDGKLPVNLVPSDVASYRGYYEDLAIGVETDRSCPTVGGVLSTLELAIGSVHTGWKGGEYQMHAGTRVWLSNPGECSGALVTGFREGEHGYVFLTWRNDDE